MFKIYGYTRHIWAFRIKLFFVALILIGYGDNVFSAVPNQVQDAVPKKFIMMSDGKESNAVSIEEFLKIVLKDAGQSNNKEEFEKILKIKQKLDMEESGARLEEQGNKRSANLSSMANSMRNSMNSAFKDSFVVDTLTECFKSSGQSLKLLAKSVIKSVANGATMGVVLLIGGALVWQFLVIPAYCKGPGPVIADWIPGVPDYWGSGTDGMCHNSVNKILAQEVKLKRAAEIISANVPDVVLPDGSVNPDIPGYCKIDNGKVLWCDKSLCDIDSNIRGC